MISTYRHPLKFWFLIIFCTIFFILIGSVCLLESFELYVADKFTRKTSLLAIFGILLLGFSISLPYSYWKNSPKISVDENSIRFGSEIFQLNDIDCFDLTAKVPFHYFVGFPMEGSTITFRDGTVRNFIDDMYANSSEIKSFLKHKLDGVAYLQQPVSRTEKILVNTEPKEVFKGNPFTTLSDLIFLGMMLVVIVTYLNGDYRNPAVMLIFIIVCLTIWFLVGSWFSNYFCVTKDFLLVGNHYLPGRRKYYRFSDIEEVVIEIPQKHPYSMRIITRDFKSTLYPASTLRTQTWRDLIEKLQGNGISVRNECIQMND